MTDFLTGVPWQALLVLIVGAGAGASIMWGETGRRLASLRDPDDPTYDRQGGDGGAA